MKIDIPKDIKDIFTWLVKYDPKYKGNEAAVAADLIRIGANALYKEGFSNSGQQADASPP